MDHSGLLVVRGWLSAEEVARCREAVPLPRLPLGRQTLRYGAFQPYVHGVRQSTVPPVWQSLGQRLQREGRLAQDPTNVAVNVYQRGQGISLHVDAVSCGPEIAVLNLQGVGRLDWEGPEQQRETSVLQPGDLLVMSGARRYQWRHGVPPWTEASPRISVVFRYAAGTNS